MPEPATNMARGSQAHTSPGPAPHAQPGPPVTGGTEGPGPSQGDNRTAIRLPAVGICFHQTRRGNNGKPTKTSAFYVSQRSPLRCPGIVVLLELEPRSALVWWRFSASLWRSRNAGGFAHVLFPSWCAEEAR